MGRKQGLEVGWEEDKHLFFSLGFLLFYMSHLIAGLVIYSIIYLATVWLFPTRFSMLMLILIYLYFFLNVLGKEVLPFVVITKLFEQLRKRKMPT